MDTDYLLYLAAFFTAGLIVEVALVIGMEVDYLLHT